MLWEVEMHDVLIKFQPWIEKPPRHIQVVVVQCFWRNQLHFQFSNGPRRWFAHRRAWWRADRRAAEGIDPSVTDATQLTVVQPLVQVSPARLSPCLSCVVCRSTPKGGGLTGRRPRRSGVATKKVAKYDTAHKKKERRKVCEQRAAAEKNQLHKTFVQRRDELAKIGQWRGLNVFGKWLMQLALRVLQSEDEGIAAQMPKVRSLLMSVCWVWVL